MKSMTGYGRSVVDASFGRISVEVRSVNHKYSNISLKIPIQFNQLETRIRNTIKSRIERGQVNLSIDFISSDEVGSNRSVVVNLELAEQYRQKLSAMRERLGLDDPITLSLVSSMPGVFEIVEPELTADEIWRVLEGGLNAALDQLEEMRICEGERMKSDLMERISTVSRLIDSIKPHSHDSIDFYREKLNERIKEIVGNGCDETRILMEAAILAEKSDISEEILRMESHIEQFRQILTADEPIGRKADFLLQEMHREVNTMASKATAPEIISETVEMRAEIDKMREIIQNVE